MGGFAGLWRPEHRFKVNIDSACQSPSWPFILPYNICVWISVFGSSVLVRPSVMRT